MFVTPANPCPVCGKRNPELQHHCSPRTIARIEARNRREEQSLEDGDEGEMSFDERLEAGFGLMHDFPPICP